MKIEAFIKRHLLKRSPLSYLLYPLSLFYSQILLFRRRKAGNSGYRFSKPIISIGNIVSGGSGKTPLSLSVAKLLVNKGLRVGISHRGYKGKFEDTPTLISDGQVVFSCAPDAGDEAYLLANNLPGCPIVVGKNRKAAIRSLLRAHPELDAVLLDDSFQHLNVHHDLDIIAFSAETGLGNGFVLPAGYLREPVKILNNNHIAVINHKDENSASSCLKQTLSTYTNKIFCANLCYSGFYDANLNPVDIKNLIGKKAISVCGIAHPESFDKMLKASGFTISHSFHFADHYAYKEPGQIDQISKYCTDNAIDLILTTEKDITKIRSHSTISKLLIFPRLELSIENEPRFAELLLATINRC